MAELNLENKLLVGASPHIGTKDSIPRIMWSVTIALIPAFFVAILNFGYYVVLVTGVSVLAAVVTEVFCQKLRGQPVTIGDGSAVLTGILLAFTIPPNVPIYLPAIGSAFAIGIAKHAFGGLGCNIWNPAHAGRAFLLAAYSGHIVMTKWPILKHFFSGDIRGADAITKATPLAVMKVTPTAIFSHYSMMDLFVGNIPGSIGETSAIALIIGGLFLVWNGYINWRLPVAYVLTVMVLSVTLPVGDGHGGYMFLWKTVDFFGETGLFRISLAQALSGGLMIGAIFMATDMVTSPLTSKGQVIFGIGCGVLVAIIRLYGGYPEGVCYSILIMNTAVWLIDRYTVPRFFGAKRYGQKNA